MNDGQKPGDFPLELSIGIQVRLAFRAFDRLVNVDLVPWNCASAQWYILRALGSEQGVTQKRLAAINNVVESTMATLIVGMEREGLVARKKSDTDRRRTHVFLTDKGRALYDGFMPAAIEINRTAAKGISQRDIDVTLATLARMRQNVLAELADRSLNKAENGSDALP